MMMKSWLGVSKAETTSVQGGGWVALAGRAIWSWVVVPFITYAIGSAAGAIFERHRPR